MSTQAAVKTVVKKARPFPWKPVGYGVAAAAPVAAAGAYGLGSINPDVLHPEHLTDDVRDRYRQYLTEILDARRTEPGGSVVTASARTFLEKRAALQEKTAFKPVQAGKIIKDIGRGIGRGVARGAKSFTAAGRDARQVEKTRASLKRMGFTAKQIKPKMLADHSKNINEGLVSKMLTPGGILIGGSLLGLGAFGDPLFSRIGFEVREKAYPGIAGLPDRVRMDELAAESYASAVGKEMGKSTVGLLGDFATRILDTPGSIASKLERKGIFNQLSQEDEVLAQADPTQLEDAYHTMVRFAPTLATDKNAVKTFLRETALYGTGPNYTTIKQIAEAENAVTPQQPPRR